MNDEAAFLAAIAAGPADQTLLLVFADWLEERGDPRGAWLRLGAVRPWMGPAFANPIPVLLAALVKGERVTKVSQAAAAIGAAIVPELVPLLGSETKVVRLRAVKCLRAIGPPATAALPALFDLIRDPHSAIRREAGRAAKAIGMAGSTETAALRDALTDADARVRYQAAAMLGSMRAKRAVKDDLAGQLDDPDPAVRRRAVEALGNLKSKTAVGAFCRALADPDAAVRREAIQRLRGLVDEKSADAVEPLRRVLGDEDAEVRQAAVMALSAIGPLAAAAVPDFLEVLTYGDDATRTQAALVLGKIGVGNPDVLTALIGAIRDEKPSVRRQAVQGLKNWPSLPVWAAPALLKAIRCPVETGESDDPAHAIAALGRLTDPPAEVVHELRQHARADCRFQAVAVKALGDLGPTAADAIPELVTLVGANGGVGDPATALARIGGEGIVALARILGDETVRGWWSAGVALRQAGPAVLAVLPELRALLRRVTDPFRLARVVEVIAAIGLPAADALPDLLPLTRHEHPRVHFVTIDSLRSFGPALAPHVDTLAGLLAPQFRGRHERVVQLLADMAAHTAEVLGPLCEVLRLAVSATVPWDRPAERTTITRATVLGLASLGPAAAPAVVDLVPFLGREFSPPVRRDAAIALGATRAVAAAPHLCAALRDPDDEVRARAAEALGLLDACSDEGVAALVTGVRDASPRVRWAAVDALGRLKLGTETVLDVLRVSAHDPDKTVRTRAGIAVRKIVGRTRKNT